ncbi:MAG: TPM domain-containing protein [Rhodocyclaceae bacterium]|nr:TPM domain-containing protein [Rhodocyclaceae bacterium]MCP5239067.1 TPM domain-containing protein [Zoogloeaceae bacterium]MCP5254045.1 TPM domain-containing protein [Zoogloeaceae bacterium]MCW5616351.1 TPM domain-containing protein [Rhodocyclaceae bacterium]
MVSKWKRVFAHLITPDWLARRHFRPDVLDAIEKAIAESELEHRGEIRFAVESVIETRELLAGVTAHQRALDAFAQLGVWDTEENSGVLIFVQLVDRRVEIIVDRGIAAKVDQQEWDAICRKMEAAFARGDYAEGSIMAVRMAGEILRKHFPSYPRNPNELPDRPLLL